MLGSSSTKRSVFLTFSKILVLGGVVLLVGCVKPTKFPRYLTIADVVNNIKCHLYMAILDQTKSVTNENGTSSFATSGHWLTNWTTNFTLNLKVVRKGELSGDTSFVTPYTLGTFTNKVAASLSKEATSSLTLDLDAENNLLTFMSKDRCAYSREHRRRRNLAGETGLSLWFGKLIEGINNANISKTATGFTYNIQFVLSANGSFIPSYSFTYPSLRKLFGMLKVSKSRTDTNKLTVTFAPEKKDKSGTLGTELKVLQQTFRLLAATSVIDDETRKVLIELLKQNQQIPLPRVQLRQDSDKAEAKKKKPVTVIESKELKDARDLVAKMLAASKEAERQGTGKTGMSEQARAKHQNLRLREAIRDIRD